MKPRYIAIPCAWCRGDHWLVKPNICTSRSLRSVGAYTVRAEAEAEAARLSEVYEALHRRERRAEHREMQRVHPEDY